MRKKTILSLFVALFMLVLTACGDPRHISLINDKNAEWICENPNIIIRPTVDGTKGVIEIDGEKLDFTVSTLHTARMVFDFVIDGEERSVDGQTAYNDDSTEFTFEVTGDDVFNNKYTQFEFKKKSTISPAFPDYNPYKISRTYTSLDTTTDENRLEALRGRLLVDFPMPQKFEKFENQVPYLYASMIYNESDYKYIISQLDKTETLPKNASIYSPLEKFDWWGIDESGICFASCNLPITLTYKTANSGPNKYTDAFRSVYFVDCKDGTYRMYCSYEAGVLYEKYKSDDLGKYAYAE